MIKTADTQLNETGETIHDMKNRIQYIDRISEKKKPSWNKT